MINKMSNDESKELNAKFQIREVGEKDMKQICDLHARCWKENFRGIIAQDYLNKFGKDPVKWREFISERDPSKYSMFVYDKGGNVVGIIDGGTGEKEGFDFEIYGFYVDPNNQRKGVGRKLWTYLIESENFKDKNSFYLWTLKDNIAGGNFYKKMGGKIVDEMKKKFGDKEYDLVCYARKK